MMAMKSPRGPFKGRHNLSTFSDPDSYLVDALLVVCVSSPFAAGSAINHFVLLRSHQNQ